MTYKTTEQTRKERQKSHYVKANKKYNRPLIHPQNARGQYCLKGRHYYISIEKKRGCNKEDRDLSKDINVVYIGQAHNELCAVK